MTKRILSAIAVWVMLGAAGGCAVVEEPAATASGKADIAAALAPSLARVEYTVQYDKGEPPRAAGWAERCPTCGRYHGTHIEGLVSEERPLELPGLVLSATVVLCPDVMIHPRFVKGIAVRYGDQLVVAEPSAYAQSQVGVFLQLHEPLADAKPLTFDPNAQPPYLAVTCQLANGEWTTAIDSMGAPAVVTDAPRRFRPLPSYCLIVNGEGTPVGAAMSDELPVDDSWKGSPASWAAVPAQQLQTLLADVEQRTDASLLRVALSFRSPKKLPGRMLMMYRYRDDEEEATERNVVGVLVDDRTVLVLADLKASLTARLERIVVHPKDGEPVTGTFAGTLSDYGAFVATLDQPLSGAVTLSKAPAPDFRNTLLLAADIKLQGERRVAYYNHGRIRGFELGWRRHVYPEAAGEEDLFLFTPAGELVALPVARREKISQDRWRISGPTLTGATYLATVLSEGDKQYDLSNVPLSEEEENRLAWIGVELQGLDKELARINNVSDLTRDGEIGALVSYVYEDSPAAAASVKAGDILLRLHVEGEPRPLEVRIEEYGFGRMGSFPWEQLDQVPEQFLNEIPMPWPPAESNLSRQLTEIGFGKKYTAEFFTNGEVVTKDFEVVQSPPHYNSAARFKSDPLGLTVRDLTYEVRRYFQRSAADGGVIISKVEPGSKAAVSGIKPYEIVTHVNDKPVSGVADFEKLTAGQEELRLKIKRMTKGRVVKVKMAPTTKPARRAVTEPTATQPAELTTQSATTEPAEPVAAPSPQTPEGF